MMRQEQLPTKPIVKRPRQMRGRFLKQVRIEPIMAMHWVSKVARLRPFTISRPPNRLPRTSPITAMLLMNEFQKTSSSSDHSKKN